MSREKSEREGQRCSCSAREGRHDTNSSYHIRREGMWYDPPRHDEPMVISVVVAEYKVEMVLIDQGNSANILYWST
ncbi:hypothetical protein CR513_44341, partial [Mucuna pruriens]